MLRDGDTEDTLRVSVVTFRWVSLLLKPPYDRYELGKLRGENP